MIKIEFEGTDGAGKTTGLKYFIEQAEKRRLSVVETREVGNPNIPICVKLRETVLAKDSGLSGEAMELIFGAMRFENDLWLKNLEQSAICPDLVVSDRGWLSHLAYTDHNVSKEFAETLYVNAIGKLTAMPDIVIYFDVSTDTALGRRQRRGTEMDAIEIKGIGFQELVRSSFEKYSNQAILDGIIVFRIDANQDLENVKKQLDNILSEIALSVVKRPSELLGMA